MRFFEGLKEKRDGNSIFQGVLVLMLVFTCDECGREIVEEFGFILVKKVAEGRRVIFLCQECKRGLYDPP